MSPTLAIYIALVLFLFGFTFYNLEENPPTVPRWDDVFLIEDFDGDGAE